MKKGIIKKGIQFYKRYGIRGGIATLTGQGQIKDKNYAVWYEKNKVSEEELKEQRNKEFPYMPLFSILVPVYNTPIPYLREMLDSVRNQTYQKWQLCIANANPENEDVARILNQYIEMDIRIQVVNVPENLGIAQNTNKALSIAKGDYIGLLDHDDMLAADALFEVAKTINDKNADVIYTNEDKITMSGEKHFQPNFKPEYNLDMLRSNNYICHFFIAKASLMKEIGGFRGEYNGAQDYDMIFRCTERADNIVRIPKVLYHWRMHEQSTAENPESKRYAFDAGKKVIEDHLKRCGESAEVQMTEYPGFYRVKYAIKEKPRVSVVIVKETKNMIPKDTLIKIADDYGRDRVEFDVVDGNYKGDIEFDGISINTLPWTKECNNMEMLNYGIEKTKNEYILVLSSYIIKVSDNYIETFVSNTMRKNVGAVGGKMYFSNGTIKNAGLFIKKDGTIEEVFKKLPRLCVGYMNRQSMQQNMQAITFDDIMFKKSLWEKIKNGISKSKSLQRDVEICTKIRGNDLLLVYTPWAESMVRKER
ncbi:glycosyltransferase family 2 protein [Dorea formicigenerans]|uniref:Glycosyltransferase n=1 Tax=Dorea formicigenerans TaxID=39486 RepID=A0A3E5GRN5_9FIRM|nr:glycosyltransferase [Dorea formicigenerans]RGO49825.1 glycosyltransferase [Dorea formicigenerans]